MRAADKGLCLLAALSVALGGAAHAALVVSGEATRNVSCAAGTCTATARFAVLNAGDLATMLAASNVTLASGALAEDVKLRTAFSWAGASRLTIDSHRAIVIGRPLTVAGSGALTLITNDGGHGGALTFPGDGRIAFWDTSGSLVIDGASYKLAADLATLAANIAADTSGHHALADNYDAGLDGTYTSPPIRSFFRGTFEGLGNVVSNLRIHGSTADGYTGMFSSTDATGILRDIGLTDAFVNGGRSETVGALVGYNGGTVLHAFARGRMLTGKFGTVGGLVGENAGTVSASRSSGKVEAREISLAGGLIGIQTGSPRGDQPGLTINSHSTARVIARTDSFAGGLAGSADGTIRQSWASGAVTVEGDSGFYSPPASAGGLLGDFFAVDTVPGTIVDSYASGAVQGGPGTNVGGLIGISYEDSNTNGPILNSYSAGAVTGGAGSTIGGLIGYELVQANSHTYWDLDTSGISDPSKGAGNFPNDPGITGLTDAQLKSGLPSGFDPSIWAEDPSINGGYPYLIANPPP